METRILLLLCLTSTTTVLALECYSTEVDTFKNGSRNYHFEGQKLSETIEDCGEILGGLIKDSSFSCYQFDILIDGKSYWLRSCHLKNGCDSLTTNTKLKIVPFYPRHEVKVSNCTECHSDKCNAAAALNSRNLKYGVSFVLLLLCYLFWQS